jgi:hypothetical protein
VGVTPIRTGRHSNEVTPRCTAMPRGVITLCDRPSVYITTSREDSRDGRRRMVHPATDRKNQSGKRMSGISADLIGSLSVIMMTTTATDQVILPHRRVAQVG